MTKLSPLALLGSDPAVGATIEADGVTFLLIRSTPHTRRDGGVTRLLTWSWPCISCERRAEKVTGIVSANLHPQCEACWKLSPVGRMTTGERKKAAQQAWGERMADYRQTRQAVLKGKAPLRCTAIKSEDVEALDDGTLKGVARFNDWKPRPFEWSAEGGWKVYGSDKERVAAALEGMETRAAELLFA